MTSRKSRTKMPTRAPVQVGDYFPYKGLDDFSVRLKTGYLDNGFLSLDSEHITGCATREGADRLSTLMNLARDLARDHHLIRNPEGRFSDRDQIAAYIARMVAQALDTPFRYILLEEHARDQLHEYGRQEGDLVRFFTFLDSKGTPATLDEFKARALLRNHAVKDANCTYCDHDRAREVVRAWRRTFDPSISAADRAQTVLTTAKSKSELAA